MQKTQEEDEQQFASIFLKKIFLDPSLVSIPYLPQFSSVLSNLKHMGAPTTVLQKLFVFWRHKDATIQKIKLKILICFNSPIIRH